MTRKVISTVTSLLIAVVMIFTVMGFSVTQSSAATTSSFIQINDYSDGKLKEKVGSYYIWIESDSKTAKLKCSKLLGSKSKTLAYVQKNYDKGIDMHNTFITNGNTIYYAILNNGTATIYKTGVNGNKVKVKSVKNFWNLAGYYDGKLYYGAAGTGRNVPLYAFNVSKKTTKRIVNNCIVLASKGKYFVYGIPQKGQYYFNAKTGKKVKLPLQETDEVISVDDQYIYYLTEEDGTDTDSIYYVIKKCSHLGENVKIIKELSSEDYDLEYSGIKYSIFENNKGKLYKLDYTTGEMTRYVTSLGKTVLSSVKSSGYNSVTLTWKPVTNASKYHVYRATSKKGTYKLIKTVTDTSYKNTGLTTGKTYYYKVRAGNGDTRGAYSDIKSAKPTLSKVVNVKSTGGTNYITLNWDKVIGAKGYQIYRASSKNGEYKKVKATTATSFKNTGLTMGKTYYYKVRAYRTVNNNTKYGYFSNVVSCKAGSLDSIRTAMLSQINAKRSAAGADPLKIYDPINVTAQEKAKDLYVTGDFSHYSVNLGYFYDQYEAAGISYSAGGENIAYGSTSVTDVMDLWMNSPGHKANILNNDYTHVGIGYYKSYWVQQFITDPVRETNE